MGRSLKTLTREIVNHSPFSQDIPKDYLDRFPSADDFLIMCSKTAQGWSTSVNRRVNPPRCVHRHYDLVEADHGRWCPKVFADMMKEVGCQNISAFCSLPDGSHGTLQWHMDGYNVYAFNLEGTTEWEWFDLLDGKVKSIIVEANKNIVVMPSLITHRVNLLSDSRVSISMVRPALLSEAGGQA